MSPRRLERERLQEGARIAPENRARLICVTVTLPDSDFPENAFAAILCSRVLHFLDGDEVEQALEKMYRWLKTGGKIFLVVDSPYCGAMRAASCPSTRGTRRKAHAGPASYQTSKQSYDLNWA